ncbi:MAG: hypothetical protein IKD33_08030 [Bacteroidales bacterium]|nr:hypothetical protein [Bacteroidales bacterium]
MKKFLFATFMGALVALAGCQQDDELTGVENTLGKKVSVTANIKGNAQSRVALEYNGEGDLPIIKVDWKASGESFLMYDATDETKVTTFEQTSGNQFEGPLPSESGPYYAEYGSIANLAPQDGTLNENYVWMSARVFDLTQPIQFEHKTTVLKPTFKFENKTVNASISKIVMGGVTLPDDVEAITVEPESKEDIFIFLPAFIPFSENHTFNFTVTIGDEEYVAELSIGQPMTAGKFYTATIELEEVIPYVTFTAGADQTLKYTGNDLEYSLDGVNFEPLLANEEIDFSEGVKLYLRGVNNTDGTYDGVKEHGLPVGSKISFTEETRVACTGDIRTLIDYATYKTVDTSSATFKELFYNCAQLTSAPALPATTLAEACYLAMFYGCISLTEAPELPAETLAPSCYSQMFDLCKALETAPALPATTLAPNCYYQMFAMCENLKTAPARLPATTLASTCYKQMFMSCTSLETAPELPAEKLVEGCYELMFSNCTKLSNITMLATDISATDCLNKWVKDVAATGEFTKASTMTSLPAGDSGIPAGWTIK